MECAVVVGSGQWWQIRSGREPLDPFSCPRIAPTTSQSWYYSSSLLAVLQHPILSYRMPVNPTTSNAQSNFDVSIPSRAMSHLAALSAAFGSLASVVGKYAFDTDKTTLVAQLTCGLLPTSALSAALTPHSLLPSSLHSLSCPSLVLWPARLVLFVLVLLCNSCMLTLLVRAMNDCGTLHATTVSSAVAFVLSGCVGWMMFEETLNAQWMLGVAVIVGGVYSMQVGQRQAHTVSSSSNTNNKVASVAAR